MGAELLSEGAEPATTHSLAGHLLVAMPGMGDPRFEKTVVFLCSHDGDGAMGLVLNKPSPGLRFADLTEQLQIRKGADFRDLAVFDGGPVDRNRGFLIHSDEFALPEGTLSIPGGFALTASVSALQEIAAGGGPRKVILALGYAGWGAGQIEEELRENAWLTLPARPSLVFDTAPDEQWTRCMEEIGIDPRLLGRVGGKA
ncbi:MAG: YqgE/AlgH family protein [Rubricella sp.]